ncbi:MAG TPA: efflux RND transporter periplasmic adaptor subunit [Tepidiformaceae bacterium]|nr:efflux RND transporter periplasmic adaptor subunit [Tepidiformaceae bacterium]
MTTTEAIFEGPSWSGRIIKLLVVTAFLAAGAAAGYWFLFRPGEKTTTAAAATTEATVTRGKLVSTLTSTGAAQSTVSGKLTFTSSGTVKAVNAAVGDKVTAGQVLATLDDRDAQRKVESAQASLTSAQLKLAELREPPKTVDLVSAQSAIISANQGLLNAQTQLTTAEANLAKAKQGPTATDLLSADNAILSAQNAIENANRTVDSAWTNLIVAQRGFCTNAKATNISVCQLTDIPLSDLRIADLQDVLRTPPGTSQQQATVVSATQSLLSANTSYVSAKASVTTAQNSLATAIQKKNDLYTATDAATLASLENAVVSARTAITTAQLNVQTAQEKYNALFEPPTALETLTAEQNVRTAEIALETAKDALAALALKAPFAGNVAAVGVAAGDNVTPSTAAFTISDPQGVRIDLQVSEQDLPNVKAGLFGLATFEALTGQQYFVKITAVSNAATVTQGVVTYTAQAQILRGQDLVANQAEIQKVLSGVQSAAAARAGGSASGPGAGGASGTPAAGRTPGAGGGAPGGTPGAGRTPGAGGAGSGGGAAGANQVLPSPGMNASITLVLDVKEDVLLLPTTAVRRQGRASFVYRLKDDGTFEQVTVTTNGSDSTNTAIATGLNEGDRVVVGTVPGSPTARAGGSPTRAPTTAGGVR